LAQRLFNVMVDRRGEVWRVCESGDEVPVVGDRITTPAVTASTTSKQRQKERFLIKDNENNKTME